MANNVTDLGKVGITMKGIWSSSTSYERLDGVMYDGSLWIALADNSNSTPSELNSNWMLSAKHGEFTEQQLEDFKAEVVAESKEEMDTYTDGKKDELDTYTGTKKSELDTYEGTKESELNTYAGGLKDTFDSNASSKTTAFNNNASDKTTAFDNNASSKTTNFNDNATSKTTTFNENATSKTTDFNTNATNKTTAFDSNATAKTTAFNENATAKTTEFNENAQAIQNEIDDIDELIETELTSASTEEDIRADVNDSAKWYGGIKVIGCTEQAHYNGTNLLPAIPAQTVVDSGITLKSLGDGSFHVYGTATQNMTLDIDTVDRPTLPDTTLYIHLRNNVAQGGVGIRFVLDVDTAAPLLNVVNRIYSSDKLTGGRKVLKIGVEVSNGTTIDFVFKPSIELSDTETDYEPYVGRSSKSKSKLSTKDCER